MLLESILFDVQDNPLSEETKKWLQHWTEYAPRGLPPPAVIKELEAYRPSKPKTLFRYVQNIEPEPQKQLLSWLPDWKIVIDSFFEGPPIYVKVATVEPKNILVDMRLIVSSFPEMEKLVLPDEVITYQV